MLFCAYTGEDSSHANRKAKEEGRERCSCDACQAQRCIAHLMEERDWALNSLAQSTGKAYVDLRTEMANAADRKLNYLTDKKVRGIAESLIGTCGTLKEAFEAVKINFDNVPIRQLEIVDSIAFCCDCCGWWSEAGTQNAEGWCKDCAGGKSDGG